MQPGELQVDGGARGRVACFALWADEVRVSTTGDAWAELGAEAAMLARLFAGRTPAEVPGVDEARRLYRAFGVDPTRTRPSCEALLRRALKGQELHRVNDVVDAGNLVSLRQLLPLGLYDLDRVQGDTVLVREGAQGEGYDGIRKGRVNLGGRPCLADAAGPFGSPTSDSARTAIGEGTTRLLAVVFAPADGDPHRLESAGTQLGELLKRHAGARVRRVQFADPRSGDQRAST